MDVRGLCARLDPELAAQLYDLIEEWNEGKYMSLLNVNMVCTLLEKNGANHLSRLLNMVKLCSGPQLLEPPGVKVEMAEAMCRDIIAKGDCIYCSGFAAISRPIAHSNSSGNNRACMTFLLLTAVSPGV